MKKWLILAVIAAVFMVMFPACGNKDDDGPSANTVEAKKYGSNYLITWTGSSGYDFAVYFQNKADVTDIVGGTKMSPGQNLYAYEYDEDADTLNVVLNQSPEQWSVLINAAWTAEYSDFKDAVDGKEGRFGVGAANPGGYPLEAVKIVWDNADDSDDDTPLKEKGFLVGTITLP